MEYLFPFRQVEQGANIIIYGAGQVGQEYLWQVRETSYACVICMADAHPERYDALDVPVKAPEALKGIVFDCVIIAINSPRYAQDAIENLLNLGISRKKIIYRREMIPEIEAVRDRRQFVNEDALAISKAGCIAVAISASGGLGDLVVYKRLLEEVLAWDCNVVADIFVKPGQYNFMRDLLSQTKQVGCVIDNLEQYKAMKSRYAIALRFGLDLDLECCNLAMIAHKPHLIEMLKEMEAVMDSYGRGLVGTKSVLHYARCRKDGLQRYTAYNRYPGFAVRDWHTMIPLDQEQGECFKKDFAGMPKYITINYGWDRCAGSDVSKPQAKVWAFDNWGRLVALLKKAYPQLPVVQTGSAEFPRVAGCDRYVMGKKLSYVEWLLRESSLHIDIDGGLVRLATQLGTKCIVLFGPTPMNYHAYPCNINISAGKCHDCYWLADDFTSCYRQQSNPECMAAIKPEKVAEAAIGYLREKCECK